MMATPKKHDYRTRPGGGELGHYLLNGYLAGENYHPRGRAGLSWATQAQPHHTGREAGLWARTEQGGIPAQKAALINHLDGYSAAEVTLAIRMVSLVDPLAVAALRWHQKLPGTKPSRYEWADANGCSHQTLRDRYLSAVRKVGERLNRARAILAGEWTLEPDELEALGLVIGRDGKPRLG